MFGVLMMSVGEMRVMGSGLVIAVSNVRSSFAMMLSGLLMMLGGLLMVIGGVLGVRHGRLLLSFRVLRTPLNNAILRQACDGRERAKPP
jgi:hypothetical protein